jgi:hypothetical protein
MNAAHVEHPRGADGTAARKPFHLSAIVDEDMLDSRLLQNNARTSPGDLRR